MPNKDIELMIEQAKARGIDMGWLKGAEGFEGAQTVGGGFTSPAPQLMAAVQHAQGQPPYVPFKAGTKTGQHKQMDESARQFDDRMSLDQQKFTWDQDRWGQEFAFTQQRHQDQLAAQKLAAQAQARASAGGGSPMVPGAQGQDMASMLRFPDDPVRQSIYATVTDTVKQGGNWETILRTLNNAKVEGRIPANKFEEYLEFAMYIFRELADEQATPIRQGPGVSTAQYFRELERRGAPLIGMDPTGATRQPVGSPTGGFLPW